MSASEASVSVQVDCPNPVAELVIVDGTFTPLIRGPSPLRGTLMPGIYALQARLGLAAQERLVRIEDRGLDVLKFEVRAPEVSSPIPEEVPYRARSAVDSEGTPVGVMITGSSGTSEPLSVALSILGDRKTDIPPTHGWQFVDGKAANLYNAYDYRVLYARCSILLGPPDSRGLLFSVPIVQGWETHVFLRYERRRASSAAEAAVMPVPDDISIVLLKPGMVPCLANGDLRLLEDLRATFAAHAATLSDTVIQRVLETGDPMQLLYAAHILTHRLSWSSAKSANPAGTMEGLWLCQAIEQLSETLGTQYADVLALRWAAARLLPNMFSKTDWNQQLRALVAPPMLSVSWDLLVDCCSEHPSSLLSGEMSVAAREPTGSVFSAAGPWLMWNSLSTQDAPYSAPRSASGQANATERTVALAPPSPPEPWAIRSSLFLSWFDHAMKQSGTTYLGALMRAVHNCVFFLAWHMPLFKATFRGLVLDRKSPRVQSTAEAATAIKRLVKQVHWDRIERLSLAENLKLDGLRGNVLSVLSQVRSQRELREGISPQWVAAFLKSNRIPLSALASVLDDLTTRITRL
jgi:hypothetical protein